jgi:hypothetical protein
MKIFSNIPAAVVLAVLAASAPANAGARHLTPDGNVLEGETKDGFTAGVGENTPALDGVPPHEVDWAIERIRKNGFSCDSVSFARQQFFNRNWLTIKCNHFAYTYYVEDHGRGWEVTAK